MANVVVSLSFIVQLLLFIFTNIFLIYCKQTLVISNLKFLGKQILLTTGHVLK